MKRSTLGGWGLLVLGFLIGVFTTMAMQRAFEAEKVPEKGLVKTDQTSLKHLVNVNKKLEKVSPEALPVTEIRAVLDDCSNFITSPPVAKRVNFEKAEFSVYKNDYELPLKLPRLWVGVGYGYPLGLRVSAGYRVKGNLMLFTIIDKSSVSVSTALFLL